MTINISSIFLWQYLNFPVNREVDCSSLSSACSPFCRLLQSCYRAWLRPFSGAGISANLNENAALVYVIINFKFYFERPGKCRPDQKKFPKGVAVLPI
jgi:hypothetical protein